MLSDESIVKSSGNRGNTEPSEGLPAPGEEFRATLLEVTRALSQYSSLQMTRHHVGTAEWWPWERISKVLYEAMSDLQEPAPLGERLVGRAALLAMISDGLDLIGVDRHFHFLLSVYMQACVLINLMNGECAASDHDLLHETAFRKRIHASLGFVAQEMALLAEPQLPPDTLLVKTEVNRLPL